MIKLAMKTLSWVLLFTISCTSTAPIPKATPPEPIAVVPKAEEVAGMSIERFSDLRKMMQEYIDDEKVGGISTLVYRKGEQVWKDHQGYQDIGKEIPLDDNTLFRIYSMTKPITSIAALILHEQGKILLNDPVHLHIPELKGLMVYDDSTADRRRAPRRPMNVRDLLTHTSGFSYGIFSATAVDTLYWKARPLQARNLDDFIGRMANLPLANEPGETWSYSVSTDMLGALIERVSGMKFGDFLQKNIFEPLAMDDTRFEVLEEDLHRLSVNYRWDRSGDLVVADSGRSSNYYNPQGMESGGGGLISTLSDYLTFTKMLLNNGEVNGVRLVSRKTIELMTSNHLKQGDFAPGWGFGLGVRVNTDPASSQLPTTKGMYGWAGLANTFFFVDPEEELIGMMWTQVFNSGPFPIQDEFVGAVYQAIAD